jgi:hypothetical protein
MSDDWGNKFFNHLRKPTMAKGHTSIEVDVTPYCTEQFIQDVKGEADSIFVMKLKRRIPQGNQVQMYNYAMKALRKKFPQCELLILGPEIDTIKIQKPPMGLSTDMNRCKDHGGNGVDHLCVDCANGKPKDTHS